MKKRKFEKIDCDFWYDYRFQNRDFLIEVSQDKIGYENYLTLKNGEKIQSVYLWTRSKHRKEDHELVSGIFVPCDTQYLDKRLMFYGNLTLLKKYKTAYRWLIECINRIKKEYDEQGTTYKKLSDN